MRLLTESKQDVFTDTWSKQDAFTQDFPLGNLLSVNKMHLLTHGVNEMCLPKIFPTGI